jgi:hypothetical protein
LRIRLLAAGATQSDDLLHEIRVANRRASDYDILQHAKTLEECEILKCSGNAEPR